MTSNYVNISIKVMPVEMLKKWVHYSVLFCRQEWNPYSEASRSEGKLRIVEEGHCRGERRDKPQQDGARALQIVISASRRITLQCPPYSQNKQFYYICTEIYCKMNMSNKNDALQSTRNLIGCTIFLSSEKYRMTNHNPQTKVFTSDKNRIDFPAFHWRRH